MQIELLAGTAALEAISSIFKPIRQGREAGRRMLKISWALRHDNA
ncbi:hypothetical protein [Pseudomonas sp. BN411]|nr:hypothetical protein [Pseudomonas sp. BN411]